MQRIQVTKNPGRRTPNPLDLRTPSGRILPY
jgi:hypothetical protein